MTNQQLSYAVKDSANKGVFQPARADIAQEMRERLYLRQDDEPSPTRWYRRR